MVRAAPAGVIAVVRRHQQQIVRMQQSDNFRQSAVEIFQCLTIALNVTAMSVGGIKVNKISKDNGIIRSIGYSLLRCIYQLIQAACRIMFCNTAMRKNIGNLATA